MKFHAHREWSLREKLDLSLFVSAESSPAVKTKQYIGCLCIIRPQLRPSMHYLRLLKTKVYTVAELRVTKGFQETSDLANRVNQVSSCRTLPTGESYGKVIGRLL